jgi:hypothetical protein
MIVIAAYTSPDGFFGATVVYAQVAALAWLLAYTTTAIGGTIDDKRSSRPVAAAIGVVASIVLVGLISYQLTHAGSTFLSVVSWAAIAGVFLIWIQAVVRRSNRTDAHP